MNIDATPLARLMEELTRGTQELQTAIPGLRLHRWESPTDPFSYMFKPHLCLIAQGEKLIVLGAESFHYDPRSFVGSSLELPIVSQITRASKEQPDIGLALELDMPAFTELLVSTPSTAEPTEPCALSISKLNAELLNAVERMLALLHKPADIPLFYPLIRQEIYLRLLQDKQGATIRQIVEGEGRNARIARAIHHLKQHYNTPLRVAELAAQAGMSESGFHAHFKTLTALSPLQYQKRIRLNEARRLMLSGQYDASNAGYRVGYESNTQFTREYKRHFGLPPKADIQALLAAPTN